MMNKLNKKTFQKLISAFIAILLFAALPAAGLGAPERGSDAVGMDISGFQSVTFAGDPVDGSIFAGSSLTVINIWQRWCGPCWVELPYFLQLHEHYSETPEADVQVWGALYYGDNPSTIPEAVEFVAENGYNWNHMLMCDELTYAAVGGGDPAGITVPQTLIVDRYGIVRAQVLGKVDSFEELFGLTEDWLCTLLEEYAASAGDTDGDGSVTATDALIALRHAMGLADLDSGAFLRADIDGSGIVDMIDALTILRAALGIA